MTKIYDIYEHKITRGGAFAAGYKRFSLGGDNIMASFLFPSLRIMRVCRGSAEWRIGGAVYTVREGDIAVVNNVEARSFLRDYGFEGEIFAFMSTIFGGEGSCLRLYYGRNAGFSPVLTRDIPYRGQIDSLLDSAADAFRDDKDEPNSRTLILSLLTAATSEIIRAVEAASPGTLGNADRGGCVASELIAGTMSYINNNIQTSFGVEELARNANLSRGYFTTVFKRYTGSSPSEYVTRCRVTNVMRLLSTMDINILDAAMKSGFNTSSGFYRAFHEIYGKAPGELIKTGLGR